MKIATWNVNGIRAAYKKDLNKLIEDFDLDFICLQEIKATVNQMPWTLTFPKGYKTFFNPAERKGYAGTAIYYKKDPQNISTETGLKRLDSEGRYIRFDYKDFSVINVYMPLGARDKRDMGYKFETYDFFTKKLKKENKKNIILCGDMNIAFSENDLTNPKQNEKNTMYTPEEREKLGNLFDAGFVDSFREFEKEKGHYTWWSYAFEAREKNIGWRIDYILVSKPLKNKLKKCTILKDIYGSDHCPVLLELKI